MPWIIVKNMLRYIPLSPLFNQQISTILSVIRIRVTHLIQQKCYGILTHIGGEWLIAPVLLFFYYSILSQK